MIYFTKLMKPKKQSLKNKGRKNNEFNKNLAILHNW